MTKKFDPERGATREEFYRKSAEKYPDNPKRDDHESYQTDAEIAIINANRQPRYSK